jgi:hypothetical protein
LPGVTCVLGRVQVQAGFWASLQPNGFISTFPCSFGRCPGTSGLLELPTAASVAGADSNSARSRVGVDPRHISGANNANTDSNAIYISNSSASSASSSAGGASVVIPQCGPQRKLSATNFMCGDCEAGSQDIRGVCTPCEFTNAGLVFLLLVLCCVFVAVVYTLEARQNNTGELSVALYFTQVRVCVCLYV